MFFKKSSLGRAVLLAVLVVFLSVFVTSCQPATQTKFVDKLVYKYVLPLDASDPICGKWEAWGSDAFYFAPDFVWATATSGSELSESAANCVTLSLKKWTTNSNENHYFAKSTLSTYVVYNEKNGTVNKNEGVVLFVAKESPYGSPAVGKWYGVKFQIDENNPAKALIEGAAGSAYNNISSLSEAVTKFAYGNTDCFNPSYFNESGSGATKN